MRFSVLSVNTFALLFWTFVYLKKFSLVYYRVVITASSREYSGDTHRVFAVMGLALVGTLTKAVAAIGLLCGGAGIAIGKIAILSAVFGAIASTIGGLIGGTIFKMDPGNAQ